MRIRLMGIKKLSKDLKPCFSDAKGKKKQNKRQGNSGKTAFNTIPSGEIASANVRINIKAVADDRSPRRVFPLKNETTEKRERNSKKFCIGDMKNNEIKTKDNFFPEDTPRIISDKSRKTNLKGDVWTECTRRKREREI